MQISAEQDRSCWCGVSLIINAFPNLVMEENIGRGILADHSLTGMEVIFLLIKILPADLIMRTWFIQALCVHWLIHMSNSLMLPPPPGMKHMVLTPLIRYTN